MSRAFLTFSDCLIAYRKAKAEAYYESSHFHLLEFAEYERHLIKNLRQLHNVLSAPSPKWIYDYNWLGSYSYAPKSIGFDTENTADAIYYRSLDPIEEWRRTVEMAGPANAQYRLIITPSVNYQILSALWIMKVGCKFDAALDSNLSYGNRLRHRRSKIPWPPPDPFGRTLNLECVGLFAPYFSGYQAWRSNGLRAMRDALEEDRRITAITMDIQRFYHRVNPNFALREQFLKSIGVALNEEERSFTHNILVSIATWYKATPDHEDRPGSCLPVGLSASKVLANVLLSEFDREFVAANRPIYYGRYVDDLFVVLASSGKPETGEDVMNGLAAAMPNMLKRINTNTAQSGLRIDLTYASDSDLIFAGTKQKVFNLQGNHGLDLINHIEEQIRRQSSEHRLLPSLPERSEEMASRALLAQPETTLEADALRKADVISVRRLGLSLLLRDAEAYARDLPSRQWRDRRQELYGLVNRHVLTPQGFFDFFSYIHRVFGLAVASGDYGTALGIVNQLEALRTLLSETSTAGTSQATQHRVCTEFYSRALVQTALQSATVAGFSWSKQFLMVLRTAARLNGSTGVRWTLHRARAIADALLYSDLGRRAYRDLWLSGAKRNRENPAVPRGLEIRRVLRLASIKGFRQAANLPLPYWPALTFPTRPLSLSELTQTAPSLLHRPELLKRALFAFRGVRTQPIDQLGLQPPDKAGGAREVLIPTRREKMPRLAVASFFTAPEDWADAAVGKPRLTLRRYERLRRLVNAMCREPSRPNYIVFPECSIPNKWANGIAWKLAQQRISLIAGLEYSKGRSGLKNRALISLTTDWPWYPASVAYIQSKLAPSHEEKRQLRKLGGLKFEKPSMRNPPIYVHGDFCFGVIICSDLTTPEHRTRLQGAVDALFVLEWNQDIETFEFLIESTAHDLHAYIVQVNNRLYGDSRVRVPRKLDYERDLVRVRGGLSDYFVIAELHTEDLRQFQRKPIFGQKARFKPPPVGFRMSKRRRGSGSSA